MGLCTHTHKISTAASIVFRMFKAQLCYLLGLCEISTVILFLGHACSQVVQLYTEKLSYVNKQINAEVKVQLGIYAVLS